MRTTDKEKTLEDYQKIHEHLERYCASMIFKTDRHISKYPNNYGEVVKNRAYKDILFKLNPEKFAELRNKCLDL
jgi:phosphopantetheine adenylyltransferase